MDGLSEQEALAAEWVANLRSRFESIGLSSSRSSSGHDVKGDESGAKTLLNRRKTERGNVFEGSLSSDVLCTKYSDHLCLSKNFQNGNSPSDNSEILEMPTARTEARSLVDLERLREKRLAYFRQNARCDSEDSDARRNVSCVNRRQQSQNETETYRSDISENEFYSRPLLTSSSSSWEKRCWSRTDEVQSPESDDMPRTRSSEDNIEIMLDWWGLKDDLSTSSELRMYLPKSKTKSDLSRKINSDSENSSVVRPFDQCDSAVGGELDSKEGFHVFPFGFDKDDAELGEDGFQNGVLNSGGLHCSSDESSDFTLDDPVSKQKSPRAATCLLLGNSPRNPRPMSKLSISTSPPVPQIKGSLYHEFSQKEVCGPSEKVSDKCTIAETDECYNWGTYHRPRSLSQPNAVRDSTGIFCPDEDDADVELLCNFLVKHKINCKNNVNDMKDIVPDVSSKAHDMKLKEAKRANISPRLDNASVSPRSGDEVGSEKNCVPTVRVCPDCKEINSTYANWCIGCGLALVDVKPIEPIRRVRQADQTSCTSVNSEEVTQGLEPKKSPVDKSHVTDSSPSGKNAKKNPKEFKQNGRRWEKSSLAWNTYKDNHLSKPPGVRNSKVNSRNNPEKSENSSGVPCASNKHAGKKGSSDGHYQNRNNQNCDATGSWPKSAYNKGSKTKKRNTCNSRNSEMVKYPKLLVNLLQPRHLWYTKVYQLQNSQMYFDKIILFRRE